MPKTKSFPNDIHFVPGDVLGPWLERFRNRLISMPIAVRSLVARVRVRELEQKIHYRIRRICEISREISMDMVEKDYLETEIRRYLEAEFKEFFRTGMEEEPLIFIPKPGIG